MCLIMEVILCSELVKGRAWLMHQRCSAALFFRGTPPLDAPLPGLGSIVTTRPAGFSLPKVTACDC